MAERRAKTKGCGPNLKKNITPRARENAGVSDAEIRAAETYEERSLFCLRVMTSGEWSSTERRLCAIWAVTPSGLASYRRAGKVALHAISDGKSAGRQEQTLADLQHLAARHEELAEHYRGRNRVTLALKHDSEQRRAIESYASVAGLLERRVSISLEADPRIAGLWQAVHAALEDRDRQEEERARRIVELVEQLNGGVLPEGLADVLALPSVQDHVRDAVKRYEAEIGARKLAA